MIERQFVWAATLAIVVAGAAVYLEQLGFYFTDVDTFSLIATSRLHSLDELASIFTSPMMKGQLPNALFFRPFSSLSWGVDELVWGFNPLGFHLTDLAIHLVNAVLLFRLLRGTARWQVRASGSVDGITRGDLEAMVAGVLFAIHPIAAETVPAIARRPDLWFGFFALLALHFALRSLRSGGGRNRLGIAVCCVLGLASKDSAVIVLPLVGAYVYCFSEAADLRARLSSCLRVCAFPLVAVVSYVAARGLVLGGLGGYESAFGFAFASVLKTSASVFLCAAVLPGQLDACTPAAWPWVALGLGVFAVASALRLAPERTGPVARRIAFAWICLASFFALYLVTRTVALTRTIYVLLPFLSIWIGWALVEGISFIRSLGSREAGSPTQRLAGAALAVFGFFLVGAMVHAGWRGQVLDEWRAQGELSRQIVASVDGSIASVAPGSVVYTVNLPFKLGDPEPRMRDHPILTDYSLQGWADLVHPRRRLTIVGLTRLRIDANDPAAVTSTVSFDPATRRLVSEVGPRARVEAFERQRRWGRVHPLRVVSHDAGDAGSRLEIELEPEAFGHEPVVFWVYSGDRVVLVQNEAFVISHPGTETGS